MALDIKVVFQTNDVEKAIKMNGFTRAENCVKSENGI